jgi:uncharacterized membrane protein
MENNSVARPGAGKRDAPRNRRLCCDQPLHCFQTFTGGRSGLLGADGLLQGRVVLLWPSQRQICSGGKGTAVEKDRLVAFSDGVIAVIITIMVLELKAPHDVSLSALKETTPVFLSYVLSFIYVAIYWNNHHHFFHLVRRVGGTMLWANLHLLFWLSLIPFATSWMGEHAFSPVPTAVYGLALLMPAIAFYVLQAVIIRAQGSGSTLARALGSDIKGKLSAPLYLAGILLAFVDTRIADAIYVLVALMWLVPDRRIERTVQRS